MKNLKGRSEKEIIVISAVNLNVGGTLTILRDCLAYLADFVKDSDYRIVAIVYKRELADFPNIEYIETQWPKKRWVNRLWYEYVSMKRICKEIGPVHLWLSLHDTTPNVLAHRRAVYCHNPFPFYQWKWQELFFAPKIVLFALFSRFIYQKNIHKNDYIIVQQQWIKNAFKRIFALSKDRIVVAVPDSPNTETYLTALEKTNDQLYTFIYAASPNSHKNFECLTEATKILSDAGIRDFQVNITITGEENAYARWLYKQWGNVPMLKFVGFKSRQDLFQMYTSSDCLVFPSKVETWGLPITEFGAFDKAMLLADLPYARETAAGNKQVAFFNPNLSDALAHQMKSLIQGDNTFLKEVRSTQLEEPVSNSWKGLFDILLRP
jgi:glycosyltransferase involved in cell wall biosynthesis